MLSDFVKHGADDDICYKAKPHIGTDNLINVIKNSIESIENKGIIKINGTVKFGKLYIIRSSSEEY